MQNIRILALGKLKEDYLRMACGEYAKRLSRHCALEITELTPAPLPEHPAPAQIEQALERESALLLPKCSGTVIALCIEGKMLDSPGLAQVIGRAAQESPGGTVTFVIGSSYGLAPAVKSRAALRLSMSPMTFPHQLARVMLLEQIYRSFQILSGGKYHK